MPEAVPKRITIYVGPALSTLLEDRKGTGEVSVSGIIASVAERYQEAVRRHVPTLEVSEWGAVIDALNGILAAVSAGMVSTSVGGLEHTVSDFLKLEGGEEKWGVESDDLIAKIREMGWMERLAVIDVAERFWASGNADVDLRTRLEQLIGKPALGS